MMSRRNTPGSPHVAARAWRFRLAVLAALIAVAAGPLPAQEADVTGPVLPGPAGMTAPLPNQVRLEARVLEWQVNDELEFDFAVRYTPNPGSAGILQAADFTLPADPSLTSAARLFFDDLDVGSSGGFDAMIETLQRVGEVSILSKPSIVLTKSDIPADTPEAPGFVTNSPQPAPVQHRKLSNSVKIPYETTKSVGVQLASVTEYRDTGVTMDVAVLDIVDDEVTLDITTTVTDLTGFINIGLNTQEQPMRVPTIDSRTMSSRLIVPDRTVFIAGLMKTRRESQRRRGIPWVSELPVLGWFLSSKINANEESELVFLVKPEVLTPYSLIEPGN